MARRDRYSTPQSILAEAIAQGARQGRSNRSRRDNPRRRPENSNRPRKRRPPVIGIRGANEVRLSRRLKQRIRRRAKRQARRKFNPLIQAYQQQVGQLQNQRGRALERAGEAVEVAASGADTTRKELRQEGLRGSALQDVQREMTARASDIRAAEPFLTQGVRDDFRTSIQDARTAVLDARVQKKQAIADTYASELSKVYTDAQAGARRQRQAMQRRRGRERRPGEGRDEEDIESRRNALIAAKNAMSQWRRNEPYPADMDPPEFAGKTPQQINPLRTGDDLRMFAASLTSQYEGVNLNDAMWAIRRLIQGMQAGPPAPGEMRPGPFGG